jgi:energy-coupling factor transport system ATP-binding protein
MLDPLSRQKFMATILDLKNRGLTILLVTHHMEEAVKADRVIVMSKGQIVLDGSPGKIFIENNNLYEIGLKPPDVQTFVKEFRQYGWQIPRDLLKASELFQFLPQFTSNYPVASTFILPEQTESIISFDDVQYTYLAGSPLAKKALNGVHLSLNSERIHGIAGGNGSGKSTLLQNINGILRPQKGRIQVGKFRLDNQSTLLNEVIRYVGLVFQNPETQFFEVFTGDEIAYGPKQFGFTKIRERVRRSMALVNLDFEAFKDRRLETLSGGEKRKVAIASTLVLNQPVLLFDEPTAGMDPASKEEMLQLFTQLREDGKTMLIASHRMNELATVTNSITIMRNGKVEASGRTQEILQNTNTLKRAGLVAPLAVQLSSELSKRGWPLAGKNTASADGLFQSIREVML